MYCVRNQMIESFIGELKSAYLREFGAFEPSYADLLSWAGYLVMENISNTDALYHNVDHTIMVTLAGQEILRGKILSEGGQRPEDWLHFIIALLCHDIGYVKGICRNDEKCRFVSGKGDAMFELPNGCSDACLSPYHVDRGKLFVSERFAHISVLDTNKIQEYIEMTRYPVPKNAKNADSSSLGGLVRAADFIGQLGDPEYLKKAPALFYEFVETGLDKKMGYTSPGDLRKNYASFFWKEVFPHIKEALKYLNMTKRGKEWIACLHAHVFDIEHKIFFNCSV
jgi:hypothetical protein